MWSVQDAKNRFSEVVSAAEAGTPQRVTKRGKPAVVVVAVEDFERLVRGQPLRSRNFIEHLLAFPKGGPDDFEFERLQVVPRDVEF